MATDDEVRADLRARLMYLPGGCTEQQAEEMLELILGYWGFRDCAQLAEVLPVLAVRGLNRDLPLWWLYVTLRMMNEAPAGLAFLGSDGGRGGPRLH